MALSFATTRSIAAALERRGLMPSGCRLIEVSIPVNGVVVIRYEKFVSKDEMGLVADALKEASEQ